MEKKKRRKVLEFFSLERRTEEGPSQRSSHLSITICLFVCFFFFKIVVVFFFSMFLFKKYLNILKQIKIFVFSFLVLKFDIDFKNFIESRLTNKKLLDDVYCL